MKARIIHFQNLSSECWYVQAWGQKYCRACKFKETKDYGGKGIRETGQNSLGKKVPVN